MITVWWEYKMGKKSRGTFEWLQEISTANQQSLFQWNRLCWFVCIVFGGTSCFFFSRDCCWANCFYFLLSSAPFVSHCVYGWFRKLFMERIYKPRIRMSLHRVYPFNGRKRKKWKIAHTQNWEVILNLHSQKKKIVDQKNTQNKMLLKKNCSFLALCVSVVCVWGRVSECVMTFSDLYTFFEDRRTHARFIWDFCLCSAQLYRCCNDYIIHTMQNTHIVHMHMHIAFVLVEIGNAVLFLPVLLF